MTPEQQRLSQQLFEKASELPPEEVDGFLNRECPGEPAVHAAVKRMLALEREIPDSFLDRPAMDVAARMLATQSRADSQILQPGTEFPNYRLVRKIGAGGMGTVYEALDLRLNRPAALKVLPAVFTTEEARVRRFEQEARAVSLLNHPNIVSIYDANQDPKTGLHYIATEFVQGKTLRALVQAGRLPINDLLDITQQIASALSAAHEAGVVHRDIKPENVMVREDGIVKVLDFGLAKLTDRSSSDPNHTRGTLTRAGHVAGTIHYLCPEQVLGKAASPRNDLFSVGVLLYELATGSRPFDGPTDGAIFDAILHQAPEAPSQRRPGLSPGFDQLVLRALEKDPELRFQTAVDLRAAVRRLAIESQSGMKAGTPGPASTGIPVRPVLAGAAALAVLLAALLFRSGPAAPVPLPVSFERLTADPGEEVSPSLSADGSQFVFASPKGGNWDIYLQRTAGRTAINLTKDSPERDYEPALSPDGTAIAFRSERGGGGIFVMEITGENPRRVSDRGYYPSWSPDGKLIAACEVDFITPSRRTLRKAPVLLIDVASGNKRLIPGTEDGCQAAWSPNGRRIAYWTIPSGGGQRDIFTAPMDGSSAPVPVTKDAAVDWNPTWAPDGRSLYFLSDRGGTMNLWRVAIDQDSGQPKGNPQPVTLPAAYARHISLAANGESFLFVRAEETVSLYTTSLDLNTFRLTTPARLQLNTAVAGFAVSPDDQRIAFDNLGDPQEDIWIMNADGAGLRRLTNDMAKDRDPVWSPDGKEIAFYSDRGPGPYNIWAIQADGSGLRQVTNFHAAWNVQTPGYFDGGRKILLSPTGGPAAWIQASASMQTAKPTVFPGMEGLGWIVLRPRNPLPDPREDDLWLGYQRHSVGLKIFLYRMSTGSVEQVDLIGADPQWLPGQKQFLFLRDSNLLMYDRTAKKETVLHSFAPNGPWSVRTSNNGRKLYVTVTEREGDVWIGRFPRKP